MTPQQSDRAKTRYRIPDELVLGFTLWKADHLQPGDAADVARLGQATVELGVSQHYSLYLHDISAGGMALTIHSNRFLDTELEPMVGRRLLLFLSLDDPASSHNERMRFLLLCEVAHEQLMHSALQTGLRFLARAETPDLLNPSTLKPLDTGGVRELDRWLAVISDQLIEM